MVQRVSPEVFLQLARSVPVIDVRAPAEFARGHVPGAHNLPLFDDLERAEVGIMYHKKGREEAVRKGLEIIGPRMKEYVDKARALAPEGRVQVYCWRGGMRSESIAWLLGTAGMEVKVLEHGYKGFRRHIHAAFKIERPVIIVGGLTGCGKTEFLNQISNFNFQVIDLEKLANHKGSVFGSLGQPEQPTNEQFENELGMAWLALDPDKPVFIEDESINIGMVSIPKVLFDRMRLAPVIFIDMPLECRVERLFREYAHFKPEVLKEMIGKIMRRLGGDHAQSAIRDIEAGRLRDAIRTALTYYDKAYSFGKKDSQERLMTLHATNEQIEALCSEFLNQQSEILNPL